MADLAEDILVHLTQQMRAAFNPNATNPPRGGGSNRVRFFAGDSIPLAAWDAHREGCGCDEPFLWVRLVQRYRTKVFPTPAIDGGNCGLARALEIEVGAARCAALGTDQDSNPTDAEYETEAMINLDDSRRLDAAMCRAMKCAVSDDDAVKTAVGPVVPNGPMGGVIAVVGTVWVQLPNN